MWGDFFWPAIREQPIWGVHPTIPDGFGWHAMESQYIFLLFTSGFVGLLGWLIWWFGSVVWLLGCKRVQQGLSRAIAICTLVLLVVMGIAGLTNEVFTFLGSIDYLWILLGLTANSTYS